MTRQSNSMLIVTMALAIAVLACPAVARAAAPPSTDASVRRAFFFAYPVYQFARTRAAAVANSTRLGRQPINALWHRARLSGPEDRGVTTPNNDTVYSTAWLDLSQGPVTLTIPPLPGRYHSIALMDIFTDNFAILGTRDGIARKRTVWVAGPAWRGSAPPGAQIVRAPTNDVWLLVRTLVDGPRDLNAAIGVQRDYTLTPQSPTTTGQASDLPLQPDARLLLAAVNAMLARGPVPRQRAQVARALASTGIDPSGRDRWTRLTPAVRESWSRQLPVLMRELKTAAATAGPSVAGWSYSKPNIGNFGADDRYRSIVALGGLAALPPSEAVYVTAIADRDGVQLDGNNRYRLTLPSNSDAKGFWSLSMYRLENDGQLFFEANPIARYAIGNRTQGLKRNGDGTITIAIQHEAPADGSNWLPSPAGPFRMTYRAYLVANGAGARLRLQPVVRCAAPADLCQ